MFYVYIIKSLKDEGYYIGMTKDLDNRLDYHNNGKVRSTKNRRPFKIIYSESYKTRKESREREKYLKSYTGSKEKLDIIDNL